MDQAQIIISIIGGIALSACCGFRIFVPLLLAILGLRFQIIPASLIDAKTLLLAQNDLFLAVITVAMIFEIIAYKIPYFDNLLDTLATPLAILSATLLSSSFFTFTDDPVIKFILGALTGGAGAGIIQASTSLLRLGSTKFSGGLGNPLFAAVETFLAFLFSILSILLPLLAAIFILFFCWFFLFMWKKVMAKKKTSQSISDAILSSTKNTAHNDVQN